MISKKLILPLALLSVASVTADASMSSLSYRVKAKEFRYELGMDYGSQKHKTTDVDSSLTTTAAANTGHASYEVSQNRWTNSLTYGISDSFSMGLALNFALTNDTKQTYSATGTTADVAGIDYSTAAMKNNGLEDIAINLSYRYMSGSINADALLGLTVSSEGKTGGQVRHPVTNVVSVSEGDAKSGGSSILIGTRFSGVMSIFEWSTALALDYKMEKKNILVKGDDNGTINVDINRKTKSKMDFSLKLGG